SALDERAVSVGDIRPTARVRDFRRTGVLHADGGRTVRAADQAARCRTTGARARVSLAARPIPVTYRPDRHCDAGHENDVQRPRVTLRRAGSTGVLPVAGGNGSIPRRPSVIDTQPARPCHRGVPVHTTPRAWRAPQMVAVLLTASFLGCTDPVTP